MHPVIFAARFRNKAEFFKKMTVMLKEKASNNLK